MFNQTPLTWDTKVETNPVCKGTTKRITNVFEL